MGFSSTRSLGKDGGWVAEKGGFFDFGMTRRELKRINKMGWGLFEGLLYERRTGKKEECGGSFGFVKVFGISKVGK